MCCEGGTPHLLQLCHGLQGSSLWSPYRALLYRGSMGIGGFPGHLATSLLFHGGGGGFTACVTCCSLKWDVRQLGLEVSLSEGEGLEWITRVPTVTIWASHARTLCSMSEVFQKVVECLSWSPHCSFVGLWTPLCTSYMQVTDLEV